MVVLGFLNLKGFYIGSELPGPSGQDDAKFIGLQFAAKFHELLMNASLGAVFFSYIRHKIAVTDGVPFGALSAGFRFKEISFIWSMEFWSLVSALVQEFKRHGFLVILSFVCTALSLSTGPSSATLVRPRLQDWAAGGTDFWIDLPAEDLWSTNVSSLHIPISCTTDTGDASCPYGDWQNIAQGYLSYWQDVQPKDWPFPSSYAMPGLKSTRHLLANNRSPLLYYSPSFPFTTATLPSYSLAYALSEASRLWYLAAVDKSTTKRRFWSQNHVLYNVLKTQQPAVHARCIGYNATNYVSYLDAQYNGGPDEIPFYDLSSLDVYSQSNGSHDFNAYNNVMDEKALSAMQMANTSLVPQTIWTHVDQGPLNALGTIVTIPSNDLYQAKIYSCTLDARIVPSVMQVNYKIDHLLVTGYPQNGSTQPEYSMWPFQEMGTYVSDNTSPQLAIDPNWAYYLDPLLKPDNSSTPRYSMNITSDTPTALQSMMQSAGLWNVSQPIDEQNALFAVETVLSLAVVNGLARRDYNIGFAGSLKGNPDGLDRLTSADNHTLFCGDWCKEFMPRAGHVLGYGGNAFNLSSAARAKSTKFTMQANINGYAYSARGSTPRFSLVVLLFYTLIVLFHVAYTLRSQESSSSWDTISELVALAMRSKDTHKVFDNTGAGIVSMKLFKQHTQVVERDGRLQLAVGHASESERYSTVKTNWLYG